MDFDLEKSDESWINEFRDASHAQADRPAHFWSAQRAAIQSELKSRHRRSSLRVALASTAALVIVAGAMLTSGRSPVVTTSPEIAQHAISDQQLLADIDETLADPVPDALAPMELISQDMDKSLQAHTNSKQTR